ncbi:MAG: hypothetical protein ACLUJC_03240 [Clostridia bacterium]
MMNNRAKIKSLISFVLSLAIVLSLLTTAASAATVTITFDANGVTSGAYDSVVDVNMTLGATTIKKVYIKTVSSSDSFQLGSLLNTNTNAGAVVGLDGTFAEGKNGKFKKECKQYYTKDDPQLSTAPTTATALTAKGLPSESITANCTYYFLGFTGEPYFKNKFGLLIQVPIVAINRESLDAEIAKVWNGESYTDSYYKENDRYNGKYITSKDSSDATHGAWYELTKASGPLSVAQGTFDTQADVNNALSDLQAAIANLIPITQANTTALYEQTSAKVYWNYNNELEINPKGINADYKSVSADNCTASTWSAYADAKAEGQALMDSLFDEDGNATAENTAGKQTEVERLAAAADPHTLVNAERYNKAYQTYRSRETEVNSLLSAYDPAKMKASDYTTASWQTYTDAYAALKQDMEHTIVGGTRADMDMLEGFTGHIDALKTARKGLVSNVDITVSFRYVNNFAAKYSQSGQSGMTAYATTVYENRTLSLKSGHTSVADAIKAAKIAFNTTNVKLPCDNNNLSDIKPVIAVYINGESYGLEYIHTEKLADIQLHEGDDVRLARVCTPTVKIEASSGYDSTQIFEYLANNETDYQDSYALIDMTVPAGTVKVGDKAEFTAKVTGASASKLGTALDAENVTLFISAPADSATDSETLTKPTKQTTAATDSSGRLQYIFTEPGWYTVAMHNVQDDVPTFTDVYNATTVGQYYNLYAADYKLLYVAPADDEAALMKQYRAEYLAKAKACFEKFRDYDFAEGYYDETFKPAYDALESNLNSAKSFKALSEQFDADYQTLLTCSATAIDHAGTISSLLGDLETVSDLDLSTLDTSYGDLLRSIQTAYGRLNDHQKTLLTGAQTARLDEIAAFDTSELITLPKVLVKVDEGADVKAVHKRTSSDTGNPYFGWPDLDWAMYPRPDGTIPTPGWATLNTFPANGQEVTAGSYVNVRRYLKTTDQAYWMAWSTDGGTTWNLSEAQTLGVYSGYYLATYRLPKTMEAGSTVTIKLKMLSKTEYEDILAKQDAQDIKGVKAAATAAIQEAYDGYDQSKYDAAGKAALLQALNTGKTAITEARTTAAVAEARRAALAAMAAVKATDSSGTTEKVTFDSGKTVGRVHVLIENKTFGGAFKGTIAEGWYELGENDTMMTMVLKALQNKGYSWNGTVDFGDDHVADYSITYISSITKGGETLAEFTGGNKSGWMGTLNDWFTNEGFQAFSYANGRLENNDEIHIMYTCDYGVDIGGDWNSHDTGLSSLSIDKGTLSPAFNSSVTAYTLMLSDETANLKVTPSAKNKNYQVRTFLNQYNKDSAMYKRTETISVKSGDVIYVGVGGAGWPTMNSGGRETVYTIKVVNGASAESLTEMITALPAITYANYKAQSANVQSIRSAYTALSKAEKGKVAAATLTKLTEAEKKMTFYTEIDTTKSLLGKLPTCSAGASVTATVRSAFTAAQSAYNKLNDEQMKYIVIADVKNYNAWAEKIGAKTIVGSDEAPESPVVTDKNSGTTTTTAPTEVKVSGSTATATVKAENQSEILKQAAENKSAEIVLEVSQADSKGAENVQMQLETSFVKNISDKTNASLTLDTENGRVSFDQEALKAIIGEAKGSTILIEIAKVTKPTEAQKKAAGTNGDIFSLLVKSGDKNISEFNKGKATVRVEIPAKLTDKKVAAIHIADDAKIEQLAGKVLTIGGKKYYEFTTPHFSTFALVDAEELGLEVEEPQIDAKALTAKLTPIARSAKTAKKNVKVTVSLDKQDKAIIKELKDAGYTVKYRFYRSTKKTAGYKAAVTKKTASYTNTGGKKGMKYFYKVQVRVYDENGKLTAKTALKQCKYASRTWTKK